MTIATDVARVEGWRFEMTGRTGDSHDIPFPSSSGIQSKPVAVCGEKTLPKLLDDSLAYAQATEKRLRAELGENRRKRKEKRKK